MRKSILIVMSVTALSLAGCGGEATPVDRTETGTLSDDAPEHGGMHCRQHAFEAGEGWNVEVTMTSEFDNYLHLARGGVDVTEDDDAAGDYNAKITYVTTAGGPYIAYACALLEVGEHSPDYTIHIVAEPVE